MCNKKRLGFTLMEATAALAIVAILAVIVVQCVVWSMRERARFAARHAALEVAANVLEAARAEPFDRLDKEWAESHVVSPEMDSLLPKGAINVTIEPEKSAPGTKRVTVEVQWHFDTEMPQKVTLSSLVAPREAKSKGGVP